MQRFSLVAIVLLIAGLLYGCSFTAHTDSPKNNLKQDSDTSIKRENPSKDIVQSTVENNPSTTDEKGASPEEMEQLKETIRTYIFDEYMPSPDYVYARGVNWSENFYDNLTAEEIWNVIEEFRKKNMKKMVLFLTKPCTFL
ncbi:hypothetical protein AM500_04130 [Bacillus sp. FJAT-18017]|uniref:hypothetical protein n=1 Tax=Bacillus sp. FJAT-18017 TaxID=1705566 RepID=UPI0006AF88D7|nr:hypothetical protein [Bacillus sp. FJAT-18017]ALC89069.1 hypothetical protein AM500_04130 [Bacillus sp. FJAT-18017]